MYIIFLFEIEKKSTFNRIICFLILDRLGQKWSNIILQQIKFILVQNYSFLVKNIN